MQFLGDTALADSCNAAEALTIQIQQHKRKLRAISEKKNTVWQVVCCIFALCYPNQIPVAAYLARHGGDLDCEEKDLHSQSHQWYANKQADLALQSTINPTSTRDQRRHKAAIKFWKEWRLHKWVETTNLQKGIAPCSYLMCQAGGPPGIEPTAIPFAIGCSINAARNCNGAVAGDDDGMFSWANSFQANTWNHTWPERRSMVTQTKNPSHGVHILHSGQKCAPKNETKKWT